MPRRRVGSDGHDVGVVGRMANLAHRQPLAATGWPPAAGRTDSMSGSTTGDRRSTDRARSAWLPGNERTTSATLPRGTARHLPGDPGRAPASRDPAHLQPTGDYAEYLVTSFLGGELAPNSERSWDVLAPSGEKIQVKARVSPEGSGAGTRQLSVLRTWSFDQLAVVLFDDDYSVRAARLLPAPTVRAVARFVPHVNGYRVVASDEFLAGGVDITDELRAIAARI